MSRGCQQSQKSLKSRRTPSRKPVINSPSKPGLLGRRSNFGKRGKARWEGFWSSDLKIDTAEVDLDSPSAVQNARIATSPAPRREALYLASISLAT